VGATILAKVSFLVSNQVFVQITVKSRQAGPPESDAKNWLSWLGRDDKTTF